MAGPDGEARVLLTAQHIVKALGTTDTMTDDMIQILSNFDHRFSSMNEKKIELKLDDKEAEIEDDYQQHTRNSRASNARNPSHARANNSTLDRAENVVVQWDAGYSEQARQKWLFENGEESLTYLNAVDDVLNQLESMKSHNKDPGTLERAQNLLQLAMTRLVEELRHLLETCGKSVDPDWLLDSWAAGYFRTPLPNVVDPESEGSEDDEDDDDDVPVAQPVGAVQTMVDLVPPDVAQDISDIVSRLILGGMKREASQAYVSSRKSMLEESLYELGVEKLTIDEVQKMQWEVQEDKIKNWNQAIKVGVKVLFASEKQLCDKVFLQPHTDTCFNDISKGAMMQLLSFGEAVAISRRSPEKLFKVLDMYETLRDLLPDLDAIFSGSPGASVRSEAKGILMRLGEAARGTFGEFENAIQRDASKTPVPGGAVHPLNRYVMNYINLLCDYTDTLKQLFGEKKKGVQELLGSDAALPVYAEDERGDKEGLSPLAVQINWLMHVLQNNLEGKSKIYKDPALTNLFLMNNVHYMVQKVKSSEVRALIGDDWVRKHTSMVRQYATSYQRAAWSKVVSFLKDEGIQSAGMSSGVSRVTLKERFKNFNAAFDEAHKSQSLWVVLDPQLRDELRISIADKLLPAYRAFVGRYGHVIDTGRHSNKYIKYTVEDLEMSIGDFFEGATGSMSGRR